MENGVDLVGQFEVQAGEAVELMKAMANGPRLLVLCH